MPKVIIRGDSRHLPLRDSCVDCVVTSPPYYGLRDYGSELQIGLEPSPGEYIAALVDVFREIRRVLKEDGTAWLNLGDSYAAGGKGGGGSFMAERREAAWQKQSSLNGWRRQPVGCKEKDLLGIPWAVAFALRDDGWYLRSDIIWSKPNPMPESVTDRPTKAHEYVFLLSKSERYYYDAQAIAEPVSAAMLQQMDEGYDGLGLKDYEAAGVQNPSTVKARIIANARRKGDSSPRRDGVRWNENDGRGFRKNEQTGDRRKVVFNDRWDEKERAETFGKHATQDPQSSGRRIVESVKTARANGAQHDAPFGPTRNRRTVWTVPTMPYPGAHFATMPEKLVEPCILAGCPLGGLVLDPFAGSGTVLAVAQRLGRRAVGVELAPHYLPLMQARTAQRGLLFGEGDNEPSERAGSTNAVARAMGDGTV